MALITPQELCDRYPLEKETARFVDEQKRIARSIHAGENRLLVVICGPCSIHSVEEALLYAKKLKEIQEKVKESLFLVMRVYLEKPRSHVGWKGFINDPHIDESFDIEHGLIEARKLLLDIADIGVPVATEFLDPLTLPYYQDLVTWGFIGARTATSQIHRQMVSMLDMPVGFKNPLDGLLSPAMQNISAARHPHSFLALQANGDIGKIESRGNPFTHIVLRGSHNHKNCDFDSVINAAALHDTLNIQSRIMIDCSHGNSNKIPKIQKENFYNILEMIPRITGEVMGVMVESYFNEGKQSIKEGDFQFGTSITDPCIDWDSTEELIKAAHDEMTLYSSSSMSIL